MFKSRKQKLLERGLQAPATVLKADFSGKVDAANKRTWMRVTLSVKPEAAPAFEATAHAWYSSDSLPKVGHHTVVRYDPADPSRVEFDDEKMNELNALLKERAAAASAVPPDLAERGILGRGSLIDVRRNAADDLVACTMTITVQLADGTVPYEAKCSITVAPATAHKLVPGATVAVRVDPEDHSRIAVSLREKPAVITTHDPALLDPPARAERDGQPCRIVVVAYARLALAAPSGEELYVLRVRVTSDSSEFEVSLPVPGSAVAVIQNGAELPAKRLTAEPTVLTIDWNAALAESESAKSSRRGLALDPPVIITGHGP